MNASMNHKWAALVTYPGGDRGRAIPTTIEELIAETDYAEEELAGLSAFLETEGVPALEELFVRTFENNADRALEVGWHLHGENYARGVFMARMRGLLRDLGIEESVELPDHLSHMLAMLGASDEETARAMASGVILPALGKIEEGFTSDDNPYRGVIRGLNRFVTEVYAPPSNEKL